MVDRDAAIDAAQQSDAQRADAHVPRNEPPQLFSLTTDVTKLTANESVRFTAVLTDADGVDDVAGGWLYSADGETLYGVFVATEPQGTYELTLSWDEVHDASAIEFEDHEIRRFLAEFADNAGGAVQAVHDLTLHCGGIAACGGACVDLVGDPDNCGRCNNRCENEHGGELGVCAAATCHIMRACFPPQQFNNCPAYCESVGASCSERCGPARFYTSHEHCEADTDRNQLLRADCDATLPEGPLRYQCCCK